jgi:hypothetical protein
MEDRGAVSSLYPIYHLLSPAAEAAPADGVREVGDEPEFLSSLRNRERDCDDKRVSLKDNSMKVILCLVPLLLPSFSSAEAIKVKLEELSVTTDGAIVSKWSKSEKDNKETSTNNILVIGLPEGVATGDTWEGFVVRDGAHTTKEGLKIPKFTVANSNYGETESKGVDLAKNVFIVKTDKGTGTGFTVKLDGRDYFITNLHVVDGASNIEIYNHKGSKMAIPKEIEVNLGEDLFRFKIPDKEGFLVDIKSEIGDVVTAFGNSQGSNVLTESEGKVLGIGPDTIEVSCDIVQGNSGGPILNKNGEVVGIATFLTREENKWLEGSRFSNVRKFALRIKDGQKWCPMPLEVFFKESEILMKMDESLEQIVDVAFEFAKSERIGSKKLISATDQKRSAQAKVDVAIQSYNRDKSLAEVYHLFFQKLAEACEAITEENREFWDSEWSKTRYQELSERSKQYAEGIRAWREEIRKRIR